MTDTQLKSYQEFVGSKADEAMNDYKMIWNTAIEAAAFVIKYESDGMMHDELIRKLKYE